MRDVAVAVRDADEKRRDREGDQRQLPVVEEEDDGDADDRDHVLREEDQPVAEEEADRLQVDRRARHQLPGLVPVEVAEREPQQARVERIAHVPLDRDRLLAGDEPAPEHQHRPQEADGEDREDQEREVVTVLAAAELVDHEARSARSRRSPPPARGSPGSSRRSVTCGRASGTGAGGRTCVRSRWPLTAW